MADINYTAVKTATYVNEIVLALIQETLLAESVMIPLMTRGNVPEGADRVRIPRTSALTPVAMVDGVATTPAVPTLAYDSLVIDENWIIAWAETDLARVQSTPNLVPHIIQDSARQFALKVDGVAQADIVANTAAGNQMGYTDFTATTVTLDMFIGAREKLNMQNVPQGNRWAVFGPEAEAQLLKLDTFVNYSQYGSREALLNGQIGRLMGFDIMLSNAGVLAEGQMIFGNPMGVTWDNQPTAGLESEREILAKKTNFAMDILFGTTVLQAGLATVVITDDNP